MKIIKTNIGQKYAHLFQEIRHTIWMDYGNNTEV